MIAVGALFPAVGHTIGKLNVPTGVANLLGGADYGTITGWFRSEIAEIYGPLVIAASRSARRAAATAGEEEDRILALVLAHPVRRSRLVMAKAAAVAAIVLAIAFAVWVGLLAGVAVGGGGIRVAHITAFAVQLASSGSPAALSRSPSARAPAAARSPTAEPPRRRPRLAHQQFRPARSGVAWLKYLALFYYYAGHDPLAHGVDITGLVVLGVVALAARRHSACQLRTPRPASLMTPGARTLSRAAPID